VQQVRAQGGDLLTDLACPELGRWLDILIWRCPGPRDAAAFIAWLAAAAVGDLYELLAFYADDELPLPGDLGAVRDQWVRALSAWHVAYFQHLDPAVLTGLAAEAEARRAMVARQASEEAIEQATGGVDFTPPASITHVLLVPQYHYRPINLYNTWRGWRLFLYPHEALPTPPGAPPPALLRLTRAG
jgi:hypothetical protein